MSYNIFTNSFERGRSLARLKLNILAGQALKCMQPNIDQLLEDAKNDRKKYSEGERDLINNDEARIKIVQELVNKGDLKTAEDFLKASLIFLYGSTVQDLEGGLQLSKKAIELGLPPYKSLIPQATDKLMITKQTRIGIHKSLAKQKFGTQIALWMDNGKSISFCPIDGTVTQQELDIYGIPDCKQLEGKPFKDYQKATEEAKKKAEQFWQSNHK